MQFMFPHQPVTFCGLAGPCAPKVWMAALGTFVVRVPLQRKVCRAAVKPGTTKCGCVGGGALLMAPGCGRYHPPVAGGMPTPSGCGQNTPQITSSPPPWLQLGLCSEHPVLPQLRFGQRDDLLPAGREEVEEGAHLASAASWPEQPPPPCRKGGWRRRRGHILPQLHLGQSNHLLSAEGRKGRGGTSFYSCTLARATASSMNWRGREGRGARHHMGIGGRALCSSSFPHTPHNTTLTSLFPPSPPQRQTQCLVSHLRCRALSTQSDPHLMCRALSTQSVSHLRCRALSSSGPPRLGWCTCTLPVAT